MVDLASDERPGLNHQLHFKTKGDSDIHIVENTVQPGGQSGWHYHPGPSLITVKSGTATFYDGDDPTCTGEDFATGTGVVDDAVDPSHVHLLRNNGTVPLVTVSFQIVPAGSPRRIDARATARPDRAARPLPEQGGNRLPAPRAAQGR